MKVLHVYRTYFPYSQGGGEELIRQICLNTAREGVENRVFTLSRSPSKTPLLRPECAVFQGKLDVEVASCSISFSAHRLFRELVEWADLLHYHFPWPYGDLLHLATPQARTKPVVASYLSDVIRQKMLGTLYKPLMARFFPAIDRIVATSPNYVQSSQTLKRWTDKVAIIPIGLDEEELPSPDPAHVRFAKAQFGENFFFFIGVFRYYKGLTFLLESAKKTGVTLVIAGAGPEEEKLKRIKAEQGLDNVHFVGRISDVEKMSYLAACRAFVFPSHLPSESFGISLLEAAMSAKPMISCEIGTGTTFVNIDGETGLVVPPADAGRLADAIDRLAADETLARTLGANARRRYEELFTGESMGRQYLELYRELLASRG